MFHLKNVSFYTNFIEIFVLAVICGIYIRAMYMGGCVKIVLTEIECDNPDWIHMTLDRNQYQALVNRLMKI
jgi:hypothetical protein